MYQSLVHLQETSCRKFAERPLSGEKRGAEWAWTSYAEFKTRVDACASGLAALGVEPGDRVAIIANNSVAWAVAAYSVYARGGIFVPIYPTQRVDEWQFILRDSGAKVALVETDSQREQLLTLAEDLPLLQKVIGILLSQSEPDSLARLEQLGRSMPSPPHYPSPDSLAGLIYTTGTTGEPKGVQLSHRNLCSNCDQLARAFPERQSRSVAILPWAHVFGQTAELQFFIHEGHSMALNDDLANLVANLAEVQPSILVAVPRVFNRLYDTINVQMEKRPVMLRRLFAAGIRASTQRQRGERLGVLGSMLLYFADRLIFSKVRQRLGGKLRLVISGSAALSHEVAAFVDAIGIAMFEGYGLTEASPVVTSNTPNQRKPATVGRALSGVRIEIDESQGERPGEGEIVVYGDNIMVGYHNRPDETRAAFTVDGGLRTGDLGRLDPHGFLTITGRLKELYKLENGKYVAPVALEEALRVSRWISNIVIYGANKPYNVAVVVPDRAAAAQWASATQSSDSACLLETLLQGEIDRLSIGFKSYERPRAVLIADEDFTLDNGLLTPKLSVRRRAVVARYEARLDALYSSSRSGPLPVNTHSQ